MGIRKWTSCMIVVLLVWQLFSSAALAAVNATETVLNKTAKPLGNNEYEITLQLDKRVEQKPYDIVFVFDRTGSMKDMIGKAKEATTKLVTDLLKDNPQNRISLVSFDTMARRDVDLTSDVNLLTTAIGKLRTDGGTNIRGALDEALNVLKVSKKPKEQKIIILLTDGVSNYYKDQKYAYDEPIDNKTNAAITLTEPIQATMVGSQKAANAAEFFSIGLFDGLKTRTAYADNFAGKQTSGYFWGQTFQASYVNEEKLIAAGYVVRNPQTGTVTTKKETTYKAAVSLNDDGSFAANGAYRFNLELPIVYNTTTPNDLRPFVPAWWAEDELGPVMLKTATPKGNFFDISLSDLKPIYDRLTQKIALSPLVEDIVPEEFDFDPTTIVARYGTKVVPNIASFDAATRTIKWIPNIEDDQIDYLTYKVKVKQGQYGQLATNKEAVFSYSETVQDRKKEYFPVPKVDVNKPTISIDETVYTDAARTKEATKVNVGDKLYYKVVIKNEDAWHQLPIQFVSSTNLTNVSLNNAPLANVTAQTPVDVGIFAPKAEKVVFGEVVATKAETVNHVSDALSTIKVVQAEVVNNQTAVNKVIRTEQLKVSDKTAVEVVQPMAKVTVKFVEDKTANELLPTKVKDYPIGGVYDEPHEKIDGYRYIRTVGNIKGEVPPSGIAITHVYEKEKVLAPLTVHYFLKETTTPLLPTKKEEKVVGEGYRYTPEKIDGYRHVSTDGVAEGKTPEKGATITFYYGKLAPIVVSYVDKATKESIKTPLKEEKVVGEPYEYGPEKIDGYQFDSSSENEVGNVPDKGAKITFYYTKKSETAPIVIQHLEKGTNKPLLEEKKEMKKIGDDYSYKHETITGYNYVSSSGNETGKVTKEGVTIQFYFTKKVETATLKVRHLEKETNNVLAKEVVETKNVGDPYAYNPEKITGYAFDSSSKNESGTVAAGETVVTFYYKKVEGPKAAIRLQYRDKATNATLAPEESYTLPVGEKYKYSAKPIDSYTYKDVTGAPEGTVPAEGATIIFYYEKTPVTTKVTTIIRYLDITTTAVLASPDTISGDIGQSYTTTPKSISGYSVANQPGNAKGVYAQNMAEIVYLYRKDSTPTPTPTPPVNPTPPSQPNPAPATGKVTIKHIDTATKQSLISDVVKSGVVGTSYDSTEVTISEYEVVVKPANAKGTFTANDITVTYEYKKVPYGAVVTRHVDELGAPIASDALQRNIVGKPYETKAVTVDGYQLVTTPKNATGTITDATTTVVYEYKRLKGSVKVRYIVKATKELLAPDVTFTGAIGNTYTTTREMFEGYGLLSTEGNLTGKFSEQEQLVIYYYGERIEPVIQPTPGSSPDSVIKVRYLELNTKETLAGAINLTVKPNATYKTTKKAIPGYSFVKVVGSTSGKADGSDKTVIYYYKANDSGTPTTGGTPTDSTITLPVTGESIPWMNYVVGSIMMLIALAFMMKRKKVTR